MKDEDDKQREGIREREREMTEPSCNRGDERNMATFSKT